MNFYRKMPQITCYALKRKNIKQVTGIISGETLAIIAPEQE